MKKYLLVLLLCVAASAQITVILKKPPTAAPAVPQQTTERFTLSTETITGPTLSKVLLKLPAPNTTVQIVYTASVADAYMTVVATPAGTTDLQRRTIIFTLPDHRPFTAEDVITVVYWTLQP